MSANPEARSEQSWALLPLASQECDAHFLTDLPYADAALVANGPPPVLDVLLSETAISKSAKEQIMSGLEAAMDRVYRLAGAGADLDASSSTVGGGNIDLDIVLDE